MVIDKIESIKDAYSFMISMIVPRPVAFITTTSKTGIVNAAPYSYFTGISSNPPLVCVSIYNKPDNNKKDTLLNIIETGEFCINLTNDKMCRDVTLCGASFNKDISEIDYTDFNTVACSKINTVRIKESPAAMELKLTRIINDLGPFSLVIGEIIAYFVSDEMVNGKTGLFDYQKANIVGRLGGNDYGTVGEIINVPRKKASEYKIKKKV
ncbi:MAG: flavin reductase family protein [Spirochaetia bacterium]|nr:flavin reductase family protein [Spirochaetia bacterium]